MIATVHEISKANPLKSDGLTEKNPWVVYEQRKAQLREQSLSNAEYQQAIQRLTDELEI